MYAFVLNHFGNDLKYFKYELYFLFSFRDKTKYDIIYLYSINDTPKKFIKIINSLDLGIITLPYDDLNITYNIPFNSYYTNFNLLRTCNYIFAYNLLQYKKVCIIESDMIITTNIDDIFLFKTPSIVYYPLADLKNNQINKNIEVILNKSDKKKLLEYCPKESFTNGGVILFKPSIKIFNNLKKNISLIINNQCIFPNETLFLYTIKKFYNLPIMYNFSHYFISIPKYKIEDKIKLLHFSTSLYKPVYIIEDKSFDILKMKNPINKKILLDYKKKYYNKYNKKIKKLIE